MTDFSNPSNDDRLSAYLDGELTPPESAEIESLLKSRSDYREALQSLRSLRASLRSLPRDAVTSDFATRVVAAVATDRIKVDPSSAVTPQRASHEIRLPQPRSRNKSWVTRSAVGIAILTIATTLLLILWNPRRSESPQIAQRDVDEDAANKKNEMLFRAEPATDTMAKARSASESSPSAPNPLPAKILKASTDAIEDDIAVGRSVPAAPQSMADARSDEPTVAESNEVPHVVDEELRGTNSVPNSVAEVTEVAVDTPITWPDLELQVFGNQGRQDSEMAKEQSGRGYSPESVAACELEGPAAEVDSALSRITTQNQVASRIAEPASAMKMDHAAQSATSQQGGQNLQLLRIANDDPRLAGYIAGDKSQPQASMASDGLMGKDSSMNRKRVIILFRVQTPPPPDKK